MASSLIVRLVRIINLKYVNAVLIKFKYVQNSPNPFKKFKVKHYHYSIIQIVITSQYSNLKLQ